MKFSDIPGNETVKERLRHMVGSGRLPHALVLQGPRGMGKLAMARALAQYIHCEAPTSDGEPCGHCPSCVQHQSFNHVDTIYSFPVIKGNLKEAVSDDYITSFREMLERDDFMNLQRWQGFLGNPNARPAMFVHESQAILQKLSFASHRADCKIVIMWLPEMMNQECANKLLKLIEEPLPGVMFIMASDNPQGLLPTIYSRLQRIDVPRLTEGEIANWLEIRGIPTDQAKEASRLADGSPGRALELIAEAGEDNKYLEAFTELMRTAYRRDVATLRRWSNDYAALGRDGAVRFMQYCQRMTRENFTANIGIPSLLAMTRQEAQFSERFAPFIGTHNVEGLMEMFDRAAADIAANANAKIVLFDVAVRTILLLKR